MRKKILILKDERNSGDWLYDNANVNVLNYTLKMIKMAKKTFIAVRLIKNDENITKD